MFSMRSRGSTFVPLFFPLFCLQLSLCSIHLHLFFFNDPAPTAIYPYRHTLSLHDALPIFQPGSGQLWAVVNERDELGPNLVPDYLTSVREGGFYGWPYSYWGQNVDPRVRPQNSQKVASAIRPDYSLGSHVAALGLAFSTPAMGARFADGVFVGEQDRKSTRLNSSH